MSLAKTSLLSLVTLFGTFAFLFLFVSNADAQRTCCLKAEGSTNNECNTCDTSGKYWKNNDGSCSGTSEGYGCKNSVGDYICTGTNRTFGNACGGSTSTNACGITITPASITVKEGEVVPVSLTYRSTDRYVIKLAVAALNQLTAIVTPTTVSAPKVGTVYKEFVTGGRPGSTSLRVQVITNGAGYEAVQCTASIPVAVTQNTANQLACVPGVKCETLKTVYGNKVTCRMPAVPDSVITANNARKEYTNYQMNCNFTSEKGVVTQGSVNRVQINVPVFAEAMAAGRAGSSYQCSFRYCIRLQDFSYKCSNWGKAA